MLRHELQSMMSTPLGPMPIASVAPPGYIPNHQVYYTSQPPVCPHLHCRCMRLAIASSQCHAITRLAGTVPVLAATAERAVVFDVLVVASTSLLRRCGLCALH